MGLFFTIIAPGRAMHAGSAGPAYSAKLTKTTKTA